MTVARHALSAVLATLAVWHPAMTATSQQPVAPDVLNVRRYGAVGDGRALDSPAIDRAIDAAASAGGGTVLIPAGTYRCFSIHLKSDVALEIGPGATVVAAAPGDGDGPYDAPEPNRSSAYQDYGHSHWHNSLIWGENLRNVSVFGPGLIDGRGLSSGHDAATDTYKDAPSGNANKAIALKECRGVVLRDLSILHGGHFAILATGVDNLTIDDLEIDTNRDGIDVDACRNVRIANTSVNSPWDDGICLKASYALGAIRHCENVTISDCFLSGNFVEGSLLDATFRRCEPSDRAYRTGRIKLGTESNGDFRNIAITNCVFDDCRGIAIESVDGSHIEDIAISNITMRHVAMAPIFIRLGNRARGPNKPPVGTIRRITIDNVVASDAEWSLGCIISGIPGHSIEDIRISNVRLAYQGGEKRRWQRGFLPRRRPRTPSRPCSGTCRRTGSSSGTRPASRSAMSPSTSRNPRRDLRSSSTTCGTRRSIT